MAVKNCIMEAAFFSRFKCTGDKCILDCCHGWRIDWKKEEIERLKEADCSEELRKIIDGAFEEIEGHPGDYVIKFDGLTNCPFLEDKLCKIQKELGHEYLSKVCQMYPRFACASKNNVIRTCNTSCPAVLDFLCGEENSMQILTHPVKKNEKITVSIITDEKIKKSPALKYYMEITEFFLDILSNKSHSLETSIVLGAICAKVIERYVQEGKTSGIPELLKSLVPQINSAEQIRKLESVKPNYDIKLGFGIKLMESIKISRSKSVIADGKETVQRSSQNFVDWLKDGDNIIAGRYIEGENKFRALFEDREYIIRNIALNMFIECDALFKDIDYSVYDNYCCFAARVATVKMIAAYAAFTDGIDRLSTERFFKFNTALAMRILSQHADYTPKTIELMKEFGCTSPAHLAYILK